MTVRRVKAAAFLLTLAATYAVNRHVVLFGDDYWFAQYAGQSFFETFYNHYTSETGRILVNIIGMLFTAAPEVWKVANSLMLALIAVFSGEIALGGCRSVSRAAAVFAVTAASILLLDTDITRQSVYWISGSVNYVLPLLLFLLFWRCALKLKKRRAALLPVLAFLAGCSTEQAGAMAVGLCVLFIAGDAAVLRRFPRREYVLSLAAASAGLLTICLAPATRLRFGLETAAEFDSAVSLMRYNFDFMLRYFSESPYTLFAQMLILLSTGLFLHRGAECFSGKPRVAVRVLSALCVPAAVAAFVITTGDLSPAASAASILAIRGFYAAILALVLYILLRRGAFEGFMIPVSAIALAVGSQLMMLISPAIGPRTALCALLLTGLYAAYMLRVSLGGIRNSAVYACAAALLVVSALKLGETAAGYRETESVDRENRAIIAAYSGSGALLQYKFTNECCWSAPYKSEFHLSSYKRHFGLSQETVIEWSDYGS